MADISKITLPSGNTYDIKDTTARQLISGGISFNVVWNATDYASSTTPTAGKLASIPKGVVVQYNSGASGATGTGTLAPSSDTIAKFYLIYSKVNESDNDKYDEYVTIEGPEDQYWLTTAQPSDWSTNYTSYFTKSGSTYTSVTGATAPTWASSTYYSKYVWEKIGDTTADYSSFVQSISYTVDGEILNTLTPTNGDIDIDDALESVSIKHLILNESSNVTTLKDGTTSLSPMTLGYVGSFHPFTIADGSQSDTSPRQYELVHSGYDNSGPSDFYIELVSVDAANQQIYYVKLEAATATTAYQGGQIQTIPFSSLDVTVDGNSIVDNNVAAFDSVEVIGTDSTFTITQPTIALATDSSSASGRVQVATGITSSTASGTGVAWNSKDQVTAVTGLTNSNIKATASGANTAWDSKDSVTVVTGLSNTNVKATASGANTAWNSKDSVTAVTGVSATKKKLTTTSITGVSGSTNITPVESRSSQTTATGAGTSSSTNTDWLKGVSVSNETLVIGAATMNTQTTYSAGAPRSTLAVPTAASSATTVATGGLSETSATTNVGETIAIDASASGTDTCIGTDSTFTITQPTVALATGATAGTGVVSLTNASSGTDTVIGTDATFTVTQPTIALATGATAGTGVISVTTGSSGTDTVIGTDATFTVTDPTISVTPTTTYLKASASGANTAWNSKDATSVLKVHVEQE